MASEIWLAAKTGREGGGCKEPGVAVACPAVCEPTSRGQRDPALVSKPSFHGADTYSVHPSLWTYLVPFANVPKNDFMVENDGALLGKRSVEPACERADQLSDILFLVVLLSSLSLLPARSCDRND